MASIFNMAEVVEIGIEKEKKRRDFYGAVASSTAEAELKDLFQKLADWEEEHVRKFQSIRDGIDEGEPVESYEGEEAEYMKALVDDQLYCDVSPGDLAGSLRTPVEAIEKGIDFEKDAILFFRSLGVFLSLQRRKIINELVREEQEHLVYLSRLREKYRS
ncbi:MAG: ferritin family protein [PVC group bacterium]